MTMSHMALEEKPTKISDGVKVFVIEIRHKPIIQTAPIGNGRVIKPTIIAKNMPNRCQFCPVRPAGGGIKKVTSAMSSGTPPRQYNSFI